MMQTMGARVSNRKVVKKLIDETERRNKTAHTDVLAKCVRCAR
jgi:hypothetical protein